MMQHVNLNIDRLWQRIQTLAEFTLPQTPWTRRAFSPEFERSRAWLRDEFRAAGLAVTLDAGGNLVGRMDGSEPGLHPLVTGSHCDTVVEGGRYDGIIGVLAGLEVAQSLCEAGIRMRHPLEVIDFLSEEPSDYGISCVGSRAFSGKLDAAMLASTNPSGETLETALQRIGGDPSALARPLRHAGSVAGFVELHIEQGPVLELEGLPIGVVTNIVGIRRVAFIVEGQPDHAGTTPMSIRRDALAGAAVLISAANRKASALSGNPYYVVATVGRLSLTPNVANAVPGRVEMVLEVRSDEMGILDAFPEELASSCMPELESLRLNLKMTTLTRSFPTDCSEVVMRAISRAAGYLGYPSKNLPSGAGHDAVYVAPTGPIGMIFIPCLAGRSHCPEESITSDQLLAGSRVLMQTLLELDSIHA